MATSLKEGKLWFQTSTTLWKIDLVSHPAHGGGVELIQTLLEFCNIVFDDFFIEDMVFISGTKKIRLFIPLLVWGGCPLMV